MKLFSIFVAILLFCNLSSLSQTKESQKQEKKNIISVSLGVWERDFNFANEQHTSHKYGPVAAIEYQRLLNPYIRFRAKGFGGGINNDQFNEIYRHCGVSAGVMVVPFGDRFPNFQLGVSAMYVLFLTQYDAGNSFYNQQYTSYGGMEVPIRFNFVDNDKWTLGIGCDLQYVFTKNSSGMFTAASMLTYGIKF